jgi:uncharacterized membrane protein YeiH
MRLLYLFDLLGTFAFAISGAIAGVRKNFDLYGIMVLSVVTAVGGGTIRDVLVGRIPPFIFKDINYFLISILAALITFFFHKYVEKKYKVLLIMDAIGLGVFTVIGISVGLQYDIGYFGAVVMGVMTGTFGGMIRDVLQKEVPLVLQKEIYASACIIGGIVFVFFDILKFNNVINVAVSGIVVFIIRFVAIQKNWHLPKAIK